MWTIKARKKKLDGPLGCYNSLTDKHLTRYFSNCTVRRHLIKAGLLTKEGSIISDSTRYTKEVEKQRHNEANEILANAIVQKTIELEQVHQAEIKRHLEDMYKIEIVERIKSARAKVKGHHFSSRQSSKKLAPISKSMSENRIHPKSTRWSESTFPLNCSLPSSLLTSNSPHNSNAQLFRTCQSAKESPAKPKVKETNPDSAINRNHRSKSAGSMAKNSDIAKQSYKDAFKAIFGSSMSPYLLPVFSKYTAVSETKWHKSAIHKNLDKSKRSSRDSKSANQYKHRRSIEEITAVDTYEQKKFSQKNSKSNKAKHLKLRKFPDSLPQITLHYRGAMSAAAWQSPHSYQEVTIMQQHCGGNSICVFKSQLKGGDSFSFTSRRHLGYPFSITVFINGIQHLRVSTCCEYRHRLGYRLGGKRGQFILADVQGSKPCFRCQVEESLGIKRPHHPKPPEYSKYLKNSKKIIDKLNDQKKSINIPNVEFSTSVESEKPDNTEIPVRTYNEQIQSENDSTDHSEILEIEEISSENDDQEEIHEQFIEKNIDEEVRSSPNNKNTENYQENEPLEEICEVNEEDALEDHLKSLVYHPSGGSDGEDDVPCNETCMSFDYTADSDEEPVDETEHDDAYIRTSNFCRQKSLCNSDEIGEQDSNASNIEESEVKRRDSTDTIDSDIQNDADQWQTKLECPHSYSSSDEDDGVQQQVVTADIHINPSISSTKNISQEKSGILE